MPRLIEYVSIGICSGYGDGDFAVKATVADLSLAEMNELRKAACVAISVMERMWQEAQHKEQGVQAKESPYDDPLFIAVCNTADKRTETSREQG